MPDNRLAGLAQTVLGPVPPDSLGPTLSHEHLLIDFTCMFNPPDEASGQFRAQEPVGLENLGWVRYNYFSNRDNLLLTDEQTAIAEAALYRRVGGATIVDATTIGIGRDPLALARISRATGLNIIMGAGYYVGAVHPEGMDDLTESEIASQIVDEIVKGVGDTGIRAGIIGEIGCSWPLMPNERKVLMGAAAAQRESGASILIHPGRDQTAPGEILDILAEAGADIERVVMSHIDRTMFDLDALLALARSGCYLEYDLFGMESSFYPLADIDLPSDAQRINTIKRLIEEGHGKKVVVSHDVCTKHRLVRYGGHGYGHILQNIVPRMRRRGFSEDEIHSIIVASPKRVLTFI